MFRRFISSLVNNRSDSVETASENVDGVPVMSKEPDAFLLWRNFNQDYIDSKKLQMLPANYLDARVRQIEGKLAQNKSFSTEIETKLISEILEIIAEIHIARKLQRLKLLDLFMRLKNSGINFDGSLREGSKTWIDAIADYVNEKRLSFSFSIEVSDIYKEIAEKHFLSEILSDRYYMQGVPCLNVVSRILEGIEEAKLRNGNLKGVGFDQLKKNDLFKKKYNWFIEDFRERYYDNFSFNAKTRGYIKTIVNDKLVSISAEDVVILDILMMLDACFKALIVERLIDNGHMDALLIKYKQLVYTDEYGDFRAEDWKMEVDKFVNRKILSLNVRDYINDEYFKFAEMLSILYVFEPSEQEIVSLIVSLPDEVMGYSEGNGGIESDFAEVFDAFEFESYVARIVSESGWVATLCGRSGDQGIDLLASKGTVKIGIQCKLYSQPVGNSAVQQVHAGCGYYSTELGVVVTNNAFTKSAQQLAESLGVVLLHYSKLNRFLSNYSINR